jgi:hypothetical protein
VKVRIFSIFTWGRKGCLPDLEFSKKHQAGHAFSPGTFSVGDF